MATVGEEDQEQLNQDELMNFSEGDTPSEEQGSLDPKSGKNKSSISDAQSQEYRRKKKDALEGKDDQKLKSSESDSQGRGRVSDKTKGEGTGMQGSLQSGQTTVQFSSGGGAGGNANMASSLTSLLGLFASSAALARTESGVLLNLSSQSNNLIVRSNFQHSGSQLSSLGEEGKNLRVALGSVVENLSEQIVGSKSNLDTGGTTVIHAVSNVQDNLSVLLKNVGTQESGESNTAGGLDKVLVTETNLGFTFIQPTVFNTSGFFFNNANFAFKNSSVDFTTGGLTPYSGVITTYLAEAGLSKSSSYSYEVVSPLNSLNSSTTSFPNGIAVTPNGDLSVNVTQLSSSPITSADTGLMLTPTGDLYANVTKPLSVLVNITSGSNVLPVRIDVGPGELITTSIPYNGTTGIIGSGSSGSFSSSVFQASDHSVIVGTAPGFAIDGTGNGYFSTYSNGSYSLNNFSVPLSSSTPFVVPGNVIFRHVGTSLSTIPTEETYGNFIDSSVILPEANSFYNLQFGNNVLDVFGTKYGIGRDLTVVLPTGQGALTYPGSYPNTLTMGGNTLAGFGLAYGDFQTLTLSAQSGPIPTGSLSPTQINFNGNTLYVDKAVDSTLFPHLQSLNLQIPTVPGQISQLTNININFKDSLLHGNDGTNVFYGDIQSLGGQDFRSPLQAGEYDGFMNGVTVTTIPDTQVINGITVNNAHVMITAPPLPLTTTTDGAQIRAGNNTITWGNDTYTGGKGTNAYHFTLVGDTNSQPVMQGNALITNFNSQTDSLDFQITPALFRALDLGHNKTVSVSDLATMVTAQNQNTAIFDPVLGKNVTGTILSFVGGGSLSLEGVTVSDIQAIPNITIETNLTYIPITAITPTPAQPLIYGIGPDGATAGTYYIDLDQFFNNSLYATYSTTGLPSGVTIDLYGNITVQNQDAFLNPITITATDQNQGTATSTFLTGFLDAPETMGIGGTISGSATPDTPSILQGTQTATFFGHDVNLSVTSTAGTSLTGTIHDYAANLIVDTTGLNSSAYGDYQTINFNSQGTDNFQYTAAPTAAEEFGEIDGNTLQFHGNAFDINGTVYGVAQDFTITVQGGDNADVRFTNTQKTAAVDLSAHFNANHIIFGSQTIYGQGTLFGDMDIFKMDVEGGTGNAFSNLKGGVSGVIDASANAINNHFTFNPVQIIVQGDAANQVSTLYGSMNQLSLMNKSTVPPTQSASLTLTETATFSGNSFVFGNDTLTGGLGNTVFVGHAANFGDPYNFSGIYNGFVNGVTVSVQNLTNSSLNNFATLTITDKNNNSITWGNNTYTGGQGQNTYNFTIIKDVNDRPVMQGYDTITNFDLQKDTLVFNIESNLFKILGMNTTDSQFTLAQKLDSAISINNTSAGSYILFQGGLTDGDLFLQNLNLGSFGIGSLALLEQQSSGSIQINQVGISYTPPQLVTNVSFDPVFVNFTQPLAFAQFITNADPTSLTYSQTGLPAGITLDAAGTLTVAVSGPVDGFVTVTASDGTPNGNVTLPTLHIFALNPPDGIVHKDTTSVVMGTTASEAFETSTAGNTIIGGGADILFDPATNPTTPGTPLVYGSNLIYDVSAGGHTAIGDVQNIKFTDNATSAGNTLSNQTIQFGANLFGVDAGSGGVIYGNAQNLLLSAAGGADTNGSIDATIANNSLGFGSNTVYGNGLVYGNVQNVSLTLTDPASGTPISIGSSSISGNTFDFSPNKLTGGGSTTSLYASIETLTIANEETSAFTRTQAGTARNNTFSFGNSQLTAGSGNTHFYGDIGDLSNTAFVTGYITLSSSSPNIQIQDLQGNKITWGNDTFVNGSGADINTFTLFDAGSAGTPVAVMQGNATISNFTVAQDTLDLQISPLLFKEWDTNHDRVISAAELNAAIPAFTQSGADTLIKFDNGLGGSITLSNLSLTNFSGFTHLTTELAYTPTPITVNIAAASIQPVVLTAAHGAYGNLLDSYFNNVDIGNTGSTYSVSSVYSIFPNASALTFSSDGYGTVTASSNEYIPSLSYVNVTPHDVHFSQNIVTVPLVMITTHGTLITDPGTGTYEGGVGIPLLQGTVGNETLYGYFGPSVTYWDDSGGGFGLGAATIINTHTGNTAYGVTQNLSFNFDNDPNSSYSTATATTGKAETFDGGTYNLGNNVFDVNGTIYGIADQFSLNVQGVSNTDLSLFQSSAGATLDATTNVQNYTFNFDSQTMVGQGGTFYGDLNTFSISVTGGQGDNIGSIGLDVSTHVTGNTFNFNGNTILVLGSDPSTIYPALNKLEIQTQDGTNNSAHNGSTLMATGDFSNNQFIFYGSVAIAGSGDTHFYGDVADLSATNFATQLVTPLAEGIQDTNGNQLWWGQDVYVAGSGVDTFSFNLVDGGTASTPIAIMVGNAEIKNFNLAKDTLDLKLSSVLYKAVDSNHDRVVSTTELGSVLPAFTHSSGNTTLTFYQSGGNTVFGGAITFDNLSLTNLDSITNLIIEPGIGTNSPITVNTTTTAQPAIFAQGTYGFVLDNYFNHVDIGNTGSTYTVTSVFSPLSIPSALSFSSDNYGTLTASGTSAPVLSYVNITPNDVHFSSNSITLPLMMGVFNGTTLTDPQNGFFLGVAGSSNYLFGHMSENMYGNKFTYTYAPSASVSNTTLSASSWVDGAGNLLINTNSNTIAYGDAQTINLNFINNSSFSGAASFDKDTMNFGSNAFDVNGTAFGLADTLSLQVQGRNADTVTSDTTHSASLTNSSINFGGQTIFGSGTLYGDLNAFDISVLGGTSGSASSGTTLDVSATVSGNTFTFLANHLAVIGDNFSTLYPGINTLSITTADGTVATGNSGTVKATATFSDNQFIFGDSILIAGSGGSHQYGDIADLSSTAFVKNFVTLDTTTNTQHVIIKDSQGNSISWGNDTFINGSGVDTNTFTLFDAGTSGSLIPVMQGNATINNFDLSHDTLDLKFSTQLFRALDTNYSRSVTAAELNALLPSFTTNGTNTEITFYNGVLGANTGGSITFDNLSLTDFASFSNLTIELAYTASPITINTTAAAQPIIFSQGTYGNNLDTYFNNVDIANLGSTYTVTSVFSQLPVSNALTFASSGTVTASNTTTPTLNYVNIKPTDIHFSTNTVNLPMVMGVFNGTTATDPLTGTFVGSTTEGQLLNGQQSNETIYGNTQSYSLAPTASLTNTTNSLIGGNMIIDTNAGNTAYGEAKDISLSFINSSSFSDAASFTQNTFSFGSNAFDVNGTVLGISDSFVIKVQGRDDDTASTNTDHSSQLSNNTLNFAAQTLFGSGTLYGDFNTFQVDVLGGKNGEATDAGVTLNVSAKATSNTFNFSPNQILVLGNDPSTVYTGIKTLSFSTTNGTAASTNVGTVSSTASLTNNQWTFGNSVAIAGTGGVHFYGDIGDLSNTGFVTGYVTLPSSSPNVQIQDLQGNKITWGNDTFVNGSGADTNTFTLFDAGSAGNPAAVMQGNATISNFTVAQDTLDLQISPLLFKEWDTNHDRVISAAELNAAIPAFTQSGADTLIKFDNGLGGSITLSDLSLTNFSGFTHLTTELAYTPTPITVNTAAASIQPVVLKANHGAYGNLLDSYFNNVDIGNTGSTYSVSNVYSDFPKSSALTFSSDGYGTVTAANNFIPSLSYVNITAHDVHFSQNIVTVPLVIIGTHSTVTPDPGTGVYVGGFDFPFLQGTVGNETLYGYSAQSVTYWDENNFDSGLGAATIINTHTGNTAYGVTKNLNFNFDNDPNSSSTATATTGKAETFDSGIYSWENNVFDVNGTIYGIADKFSLNVQGINNTDLSIFESGAGATLDATTNITNYQFNFGNQTMVGQGGTFYGDFNTFSISVTGGQGDSIASIGLDVSTHVTGNTFSFYGNKILVLGSDPSTIYSAINKLEIQTQDGTNNSSFNGSNLMSTGDFSSNQFIFYGSVAIAGSGDTHFYGDVADLSATNFATQTVTPLDWGIQDANGNQIWWWQDVYVAGSGADTFSFNLVDGGTASTPIAIMVGNAEIKNFNLAKDTLDLKLSPILYKALDSNHDRVVSTTELGSVLPAFTQQSGNTTVTFYQSAGDPVFGGAITFDNLSLTNLDSITNLIIEPGIGSGFSPITVNTTTTAQPAIFAQGTYTFALDNYFNHLDIGNTGSTYTVSSVFSPLSIPSALSFSSDNYGTLTASNTSVPVLSYVDITPNDAHFSSNSVTLPLMMGVFNGYTEADPLTGSFFGFIGDSEYLPGQLSGEYMYGNTNTYTYAPSASVSNTTLSASSWVDGGGNLLINTNGGTVAYGDAQTINLNFINNSSFSGAASFDKDTMNFGSNAFDVNGTAFGLADTLSLQVQGRNADTVTSDTTHSASLTNSSINLGGQTIFGSGTFYGDLNSLNISVLGGTSGNASSGKTLDVSATVSGNTFTFLGNHLAVIGDDYSTLYAGVNTLSITTTDGTAASGNAGTVKATATFSNNQFIFGDSVEVGGTGAGHKTFYGDINDLSHTSFWNTDVTASSSNGHVSITDANGNKITFGNDQIYGGTGSGGNTVNLDLFESSHQATVSGNTVTVIDPVMEGNVDIYNFDSSKDILNLHLAISSFNTLENANTATASTPGTFLDHYVDAAGAHGVSVSTSSGSTLMQFGTDLGSITLHGMTGITSLSGFGSHLQTTVNATSASDTLTVGIPENTATDFTSFAEFDHIIDFDTGHDTLALKLSQSLYTSLSSDHTLTGTITAADLQNSAATSTGGIKVIETSAQFGSTNGVTVDSVLEFIANGNTSQPFATITLHNVNLNNDLTNLGTHLTIAHA